MLMETNNLYCAILYNNRLFYSLFPVGANNLGLICFLEELPERVSQLTRFKDDQLWIYSVTLYKFEANRLICDSEWLSDLQTNRQANRDEQWLLLYIS